MSIKVLSEEQFTIFDSRLKTLEPRKRAIFSLLLFCGLRNKELCQLNWSDIRTMGFIKNSIYVRAAGNHSCTSRTVPVPANAMEALEEYVKDFTRCRPIPNDSEPLFVTSNQKIRIQQKDVYRFVRDFTGQHLGYSFSPHALRHTYATRLLSYTNIRIVQQLLGHKSLNSTQIYTHPTSADCSAAVNRAFASGG
jgi:integrase/recombinase XerC